MTRATDSVASVPPRGLAQSGRLAGEPEFVGRRSRIGKRVIAANIVIAALLASLVVVSLSTSRPAYLERADDASANLARTVRVSVQSELARVDLALRGIVLAFELNPARSRDAGSPAAQVLAQQQALLPEVGRFGLADAEGVVGVARPAPPTPTERIGGKDFFLAARSLPAGLVLSEPTLDPASQKWVLVLARPLRDAAGAFAGVAYAELAAEHFQTLFAGLDLGSDGAISLRSGSMNLIARRTAAGPATSGIGSNTVSPQLQEAIRAQPLRGAYVARTALDKIERANAYVRLDEPALYVIVGLGTEEYLAPWRNHAAQSVALALLGLLGVGGSSWLVYRNWAREARAAEALRREAHRHRALLTTASDGIHVLDRGGNLVEFSDSFASMLGYEREELAGAHISKWNASVPSEALDKWLSSFQIGSTDRLVTQHRRSDGQLIDVEITMAGVQVAGLEWVYCAARDITERKRLRATIDEALARAEERERFLRELTDNLPLRIAYFDAELRFRFVNETLCRRLGLAREQILWRTARELVGEAAPAAVADGLHVALGGQPVRFEFEETHGGEVAMIERHFVPDVADDGKVSGLYVVSADVTERYAQQRRLEVALAERETLLREVYHRVKNNLQVVQSLLNLQRRALPEGDARAALDDSAQRVRAMALVHEKLYQSGTLSAVPLHDYIRDLLRQVGLAAGARVRGIELVARVDEVDAALDLAVPFGLLVTELVSNSLKHGFPNGRAGVVRVQLAREKDVLCLEVTDNGVGLPAGFDVLRIRSMGLKLAVTLAAQLGGALRAEGQGGAVFLAELPRLG